MIKNKKHVDCKATVHIMVVVTHGLAMLKDTANKFQTEKTDKYRSSSRHSEGVSVCIFYRQESEIINNVT